MNIPRFTAEFSLYDTPYPHGVYDPPRVDYLPIRLGRLCGPCLPSTRMEGAARVGHKRCCTFYCFSRFPFPCWLADCSTRTCALGPWDGVFD